MPGVAEFNTTNNGMKKILERWLPCEAFHLDGKAKTLDGFSHLKTNNYFPF